MNKLAFYTNLTQFENDYLELVRGFYPFIEYDVSSQFKILFEVAIDNNKVVCRCKIEGVNNNYTDYDYALPNSDDALIIKRYSKRYSKLALYTHISKSIGVSLPYGALTGIRPTKLYYELSENGEQHQLKDIMMVSDVKYRLIEDIAKTQKGIYNVDKNKADVFINVPLCPSRCSYCSFICETTKRAAKYIDTYVQCLKRDVEQTLGYLNAKNLAIRAVYIGGGTPTALSDENLEKLLKLFKGYSFDEFTVEAGRPDTITSSKLELFYKYGVTRISINPQSFNDKTLQIIGRKHSTEQIYEAFRLARNFPFIINMDLIAMLPNENLEDFMQSVDSALSLMPDNLTIHSLSLKKGSVLKLDSYDNSDTKLAAMMIDYGYDALSKAGYLPYYMYRQKYTSGNLENTGYTLKGKASLYNVDIMEETHNILASGAGAISKGYFDVEKIERFAMPKDLQLYIERFEDNLLKKQIFMENLVFYS